MSLWIGVCVCVLATCGEGTEKRRSWPADLRFEGLKACHIPGGFFSVMANSKTQEDKEVHISKEDQQKINKFARLNSRLDDLKEELKGKKTETETLEDASSSLMMLTDDDEKVPFQIGEVFIHVSQDDAQERIEKAQADVKRDVESFEEKAGAIRKEMSVLKTHLYAKFGNSINLEADDD